jgi:hypothetical protein
VSVEDLGSDGSLYVKMGLGLVNANYAELSKV